MPTKPADGPPSNANGAPCYQKIILPVIDPRLKTFLVRAQADLIDQNRPLAKN